MKRSNSHSFLISWEAAADWLLWDDLVQLVGTCWWAYSMNSQTHDNYDLLKAGSRYFEHKSFSFSTSGKSQQGPEHLLLFCQCQHVKKTIFWYSVTVQDGSQQTFRSHLMLSFSSFLPLNQAGNPQKTRMEKSFHLNPYSTFSSVTYPASFFFLRWYLLNLWRISLRLNFCCGFTAYRDNIILRLFNKQPKKHVQLWDCPHQKDNSSGSSLWCLHLGAAPPLPWHIWDNSF